jgi:hypothetical protein
MTDANSRPKEPDTLSRLRDAIHFERWGYEICDVHQSLPSAGAIGYSAEDAIALRDWLIKQHPLPTNVPCEHSKRALSQLAMQVEHEDDKDASARLVWALLDLRVIADTPCAAPSCGMTLDEVEALEQEAE